MVPQKPGCNQEVVHPNAAGIDIGSRSHWVAVGQDAEDIKEFGVYSEDQMAMSNWLKSKAVTHIAMESTDIITTTTTNHCPYAINQCPNIGTGELGPCDNCSTNCSTTSSSTVSYCDGWWEEPSGGGGGGTGSGTGGGGTGGGGGGGGTGTGGGGVDPCNGSGPIGRSTLPC
ncbi:hypothetical protein B566_EDAN019234, partial [Ephemera danica]